jgi:hypothetical protein
MWQQTKKTTCFIGKTNQTGLYVYKRPSTIMVAKLFSCAAARYYTMQQLERGNPASFRDSHGLASVPVVF